MASIVGKRRGGQTYYYLVESARVDGKPRIVSQQYLGSSDEVIGKLTGQDAGVPVRSRHKKFGDIAAVWSVIERLGVIEEIDQIVPRRTDAAASVGTYLALAAANRIVDPVSKLGFADWFATTAAARWVKIPTEALDHRRFWDAMDRVSTDDLARIETQIGRRIVAQYGLDLSGLVLDMTNFATFIDSGNERAPIAQRGHAKQKRTDLRLVGLGLIATRDGGIPLISHTYPGDRPDVTQFPQMLAVLLERFTALGGTPAQVTVVYDAGQNSGPNHALIEASGLGFVGSLPPSDHPDLLAKPRRGYRDADPDTLPGVTCLDTTVTALGATGRAVLTHSQTLHQAQHRGFDQTLAKARRHLTELQARLGRGKTRRPREKVEAEIAEILRPRWVSQIITATVLGDSPAEFTLSWRTDQQARRRLENRLFGKRILFTNRDDWTCAEVIRAYRSQSQVEAGFRQMKDTDIVSFSPLHHFTDSKIRVHAFYCVLALAIAHLMRRETERAGQPHSVGAIMRNLAALEETVLLYHDGDKGRPRAQRLLTDMTAEQQNLANIFEIQRYAPTR
jgi:transposase